MKGIDVPCEGAVGAGDGVPSHGIKKVFLFHPRALLSRCHRHNSLVLLNEARKRQRRRSATTPHICSEEEVVPGALSHQVEVAGVRAAAEIVDALLCHSCVTCHVSQVSRQMSRTQLPTEPVKENAAMKVTPVVPGVRTKEP